MLPRCNHLVPVPEVDTLAELNAMIDRWDQQDDARCIRSRPRTIGEYFAAEQPLLAPLPEGAFETGRLSTPRVDRYRQICVRMNCYSVRVRLIGRTVRVILHASELVAYDGREEVAEHERLIARNGTRLELDHYLEALIRKPGALPGATALDQARAAGRFTPIHDASWEAAVKAHGEREGTGALIEVLLLSRHLPHEHLVAGLAAALKSGALTADARRPGSTQGGRRRHGARAASGFDRVRKPDRHGPAASGCQGPSAAGQAASAVCRPLRPASTTPPARPPQPVIEEINVPLPRQRGLTEQAATTGVDQAWRMLRLPTIRSQFSEVAETAEREQMSYLGFLAELLLAECDDRARRRSERRIKAAGFPRGKSLRKFDFDASPNIDRQ